MNLDAIDYHLVSFADDQTMVAGHTHQSDNIEYMSTNEGTDAC
jgi:hypothetical protein